MSKAEAKAERAPLTTAWALFGLSVGIGVLRRWNWARWTVVGVSCFSLGKILFTLVGWLVNQPPDLHDALEVAGLFIILFVVALFVVWNSFLIWYFLRPAVKAQFVKAAT